VDDELRERLGAAAYGRVGFAADYDRYRPRPPAALLELLPALAGVERPRLVVDLGSGTGLSTRFWADVADVAVGVEMNEAMRDFSEEATEAPNVRYVRASGAPPGKRPRTSAVAGGGRRARGGRPFPRRARLRPPLDRGRRR